MGAIELSAAGLAIPGSARAFPAGAESVWAAASGSCGQLGGVGVGTSVEAVEAAPGGNKRGVRVRLAGVGEGGVVSISVADQEVVSWAAGGAPRIPESAGRAAAVLAGRVAALAPGASFGVASGRVRAIVAPRAAAGARLVAKLGCLTARFLLGAGLPGRLRCLAESG
ncbi:MAG: hypothetical protein JOZ81_17575 [Chloroflexi bacterium]|nr:hypothetical protein [Chloroflexota bacterium]